MTEKIYLTDLRILIDCKFLIGSFFIIFKNSQQIPNLAMITLENNTGAYSIKCEHISGNHFTPWSFSFFSYKSKQITKISDNWKQFEWRNRWTKRKTLRNREKKRLIRYARSLSIQWTRIQTMVKESKSY